ncbi:universal stress protein [Capnocytophaga cynodegmi]|uniref:universal stress protein n=1 Tax=Capnocytophaga cynodegmi TaxID=28189 RepID=UPI001AC3B6F6|nr:universal stress protein [Capnocytophaga cynodegmi]GIM53135.1 universal stress protein UspA [Capnocytophaga cynodegmi]GIM54327.1 universal stress protein UspA [Capnocytophaga cynodegmi]GJQ06637.1 universal stress protein UspA [Capnocytophaga cynodegmi]
MKKILVTTDFSEKSIASLKVAIELAKRQKAEVFLLHALELPFRLATQEHSSIPEAMYFLNLSKQRFDSIKKELGGEIEIKDLIETAPLADAVEDVVKKYGIDLVFMGSNGASGTKELFIGSNAEKVIRTASVPVLVIKNPEEKLNIKHIMFACDFTKRFLKPFEKAVKFAELFNAKIDLVFVNTPYQFLTTSEIRERMNEFLESQNSSVEEFETHVYNDIRIETGILNYVAENDIDLICMFPSGRKGIAHFFNGSISSDLVNHATKPVLTIKM